LQYSAIAGTEIPVVHEYVLFRSGDLTIKVAMTLIDQPTKFLPAIKQRLACLIGRVDQVRRLPSV
jgi:hypothetical protein